MTNRTLIITACIVGPALPATADTLHVPSPYGSIQQAISAASDGDEIVVGPGTYNESINFSGKDIRIRSSSGAASTIIDASGLDASAVIAIDGESDDALLEGFTITGGTGDSSVYGMPLGGGMIMFGTSVNVRDCIFEDNIANMGGGLAVIGGAATIEGCTFRRNTANGFSSFGTGGGGMALHHSYGRVMNCSFEGNFASLDGGGMVVLSGDPVLTNSTFIGNAAAAFGGAMQIGMNDMSIINCTFSGNDALSGDAVRTWSNGTPFNISVINCIIWGHEENSVLALAGAEATVRNSVVEFGWDGDGVMNVTSDPLFNRAPSAGADDAWGTADDDYGDLCPQGMSVAIDAGDTDAVPSYISTDIQSNARVVHAAVDAGAHEYNGELIPDEVDPCRADIEPDGGNGDVNMDDILYVINAFGSTEQGSLADMPPEGGNGVIDIDDLIFVLLSLGPCDA